MAQLVRLGVVGFMVLLVTSLVTAAAANNTVPATRAGVFVDSITPNKLKPTQCSGIAITNLVVASGAAGATTTGLNGQRNLILGSGVNDDLNGGNGDDCIIGGAGDDTLRGAAGNDVLLGGPNTGVGDTCTGGSGSNAVIACEH